MSRKFKRPKTPIQQAQQAAEVVLISVLRGVAASTGDADGYLRGILSDVQKRFDEKPLSENQKLFAAHLDWMISLAAGKTL